MPTNSNDFSIVIAQELYNSQDKFPVDFDIAWKWLEYSTKGNAKRVLLSGVFIEGTDLIINQELGSLAIPRPSEKIYLTVDCFKMWAMMSGTEKGKQVRLYFLECEKIAKAIEVKPKTAIELAEEQLLLITKQVELLKEIEAKNQQLALANSQIEILEEVNLEQAEVIDELFDYSSIIRIAKYNNCSEKTFSWHKLKAASLALNLEIKKAPCPRYGTKNLYSHDVWRFAYPGYKLPEDNQSSNIIPFPKVN